MRLHQLNDPLELIADVQLVRIEHDDDEIGPLGEPPHDRLVVVIPTNRLFLAGQNAGRVHKRNVFENGGVHFHTLESTEEVVAKGGEAAEGFVHVGTQGRTRHDLINFSVHDGNEAIGGGLRTNTDAGKVPPEEVSNKRCLADTA